MQRIFLDIEALPTAEKNRDFVERKLQKSLNNRRIDCTEAEFAERVESAFRETALSGSLGQLLCIGLMIDNNGRPEKPCVCGQDKLTGEFHLDEAKTLSQFWNHLDRIGFDARFDQIIGHNILDFDLPFLYQRSMIYGVRPSRQILGGKPWEIPVFDTMIRWQMGKRSNFAGLEELALAFGLDCPKSGEVKGENLLDAFLAGKHREIREYCINDVLCTRRLYYKMTFENLPLSVSESVENLALAN